MRIRYELPALLALGLMAACSSSGPTTTVSGYTVTVKTAPPASAPVGAAIPIAFTATENESDGTSKPAAAKTFTVAVTAGGGLVNGLASATITTAADGSASLTWTLGPATGTQTLRGSVSATQFLDVSVTATPPPPTQLAVTTQPSTTASAGVALARQPTVQLKDASGNNALQSGVPVTATIASGGGTLAGTVTVNSDANGLASFTNLVVNGVTGNVTLNFAATLNGTAASVVSQAVAVSPAPPVQLAIVTQPAATATVGTVLTRQPVLQLKDINGNNAAQAGVSVTASVATGTSVLGGTLTASSDATGLVTFTNLVLSGATGSATLNFTATLNGASVTLASQAIVVSPLPPAQLLVVTQPSTAAIAGVALTRQPIIQLLNANSGNAAQAGVPVTVSIATGGGTIGGTLTVNSDATGLVTFSNIVLSGVTGTVTLKFAATLNGAAATAVSQGMSVTPAPSQLTIATQPAANAIAGVALTQQPVVQLKDVNGNSVLEAGIPVTASIATGGSTLGGTATVNSDANGLATFAGLSLNGVAGPATLKFTATLSGVPATVTSNSISVLLPITSVTLTGSAREKVGENYPYTVTERLADGTLVQRPVTWSIQVPVTAAITQAGVVTPLQAGPIGVVATIDGVDWIGMTTGYDWVVATDTTGTTASLASDDSFVDALGNPVFPNLQISCSRAGAFRVSIGFGEMVTNDGNVTFTGDNAVFSNQTWNQTAPDFHVLVYPAVTNALQKSFANTLSGNTFLYMAFHEAPGTTHSDIWHLTGMATAIAPVVTACPSNSILAGPSAAQAGAGSFPTLRPALRAPAAIPMRVLVRPRR